MASLVGEFDFYELLADYLYADYVKDSVHDDLTLGYGMLKGKFFDHIKVKLKESLDDKFSKGLVSLEEKTVFLKEIQELSLTSPLSYFSRPFQQISIDSKKMVYNDRNWLIINVKGYEKWYFSVYPDKRPEEEQDYRTRRLFRFIRGLGR